MADINHQEPRIDPVGYCLIGLLLLLLSYAGWLSYKSIDWTVLKRLESQTLVLPTPILSPPSTPSAQVSTSSSNKK